MNPKGCDDQVVEVADGEIMPPAVCLGLKNNIVKYIKNRNYRNNRNVKFFTIVASRITLSLINLLTILFVGNQIKLISRIATIIANTIDQNPIPP